MYNSLTHGDAPIYCSPQRRGQGPREILRKLGEDTTIEPETFKIRLHLIMGTSDPRYSWVNVGMFIARRERVETSWFMMLMMSLDSCAVTRKRVVTVTRGSESR